MAVQSIATKGLLVEETSWAINAYKAFLLVLIIVPFAAVFIALWQWWGSYVSWIGVTMLLATYFPIALGVTAGLHRYFTHRSFVATKGIKLVLAFLALFAIEGPITQWVANHKYHHRTSDTEEDLHSPMRSFFYAHWGWFFVNRRADPQIYARWLVEDPLIRKLDRFFPLWIVLSLGLPYVLGGWEGFIWGGLVRVFLVHHFSWGVNSVCHTFGVRPYISTSEDRSSNVWWLLLALGEQFHRTHHAFPWSARHGTAWWNDQTYAVIAFLGKLRLVYDIRTPSEEQLAAKRIKAL